MIKENQIEIALSKSKMLFAILGSLVFVGFGVWFLVSPPTIDNPLFGNPTTIFIIGLASVLFFGLTTVLIFKKLFDKSPGLIVNNEGISDNSSAVAAGFIPWEDVKEIKVTNVFNQKILVLIVNNPESYFKNVKNKIKRNSMKMNYKTYGSPIGIVANALQIDFNNLHKMISEKLGEYKAKQ